MTEDDEANQRRRNVLKTLAAAGIGGVGLAGASGSAAAQGRGQGRGPDRLTFEFDDREFEDGTVFNGELVLTDLFVNEEGELVADGRLRGRRTGNPTNQRINERFEGIVLGLLEDVLGLLRPGETGECPILFLDVGPIFLDLLGLQLSVSEIEIDLTAVAGEGNLLGNLLCAVAGLLD